MAFRAGVRGASGGLLALALVVVIIGGVVLLGWQVGWWFTTQNTQRQDQVYDQSYGRQNALKDQISHNVALVNDITVQLARAGSDVAITAPLAAQRHSVVNQVCVDAARVTTLPPELFAFVHDNCASGAINPSSTYYVK